MRVSSLSDLAEVPERVLVINVGTDTAASLAVLSAVRYASAPVLLVNCAPTEASTEHFDRLTADHPFDVIDAPRRAHGAALDQLVPECRADLVLLLDSDAEIRSPTIVPDLFRRFREPTVFGSGWYFRPGWTNSTKVVLMHERPWMPCVAFRVDHVRQALAAGASFRAHVIYNDVALSQRVGRLLAARFVGVAPRRYPAFDRLPAGFRERAARASFPRLARSRRRYHGKRPNVVWCDTGTDIYRWAKDHLLVYAGLPETEVLDDIVHYGGLTRVALQGDSVNRAWYPDLDESQSEITYRLAEIYGVETPSTSPASPRG